MWLIPKHLRITVLQGGEQLLDLQPMNGITHHLKRKRIKFSHSTVGWKLVQQKAWNRGTSGSLVIFHFHIQKKSTCPSQWLLQAKKSWGAFSLGKNLEVFTSPRRARIIFMVSVEVKGQNSQNPSWPATNTLRISWQCGPPWAHLPTNVLLPTPTSQATQAMENTSRHGKHQDIGSASVHESAGGWRYGKCYPINLIQKEVQNSKLA